MKDGRIAGGLAAASHSAEPPVSLPPETGPKFPAPRALGPGTRLGAAAIIFLMAAGSWYLYRHGLLQPEAAVRYRTAHAVTVLAGFLLIYGLAAFAALPTLPLNLAAGLLWGPWWGGFVSAAGSTVGAVVAFCSARLLLGRPLARRYDNRLVTWMQNEFEEKGWRSVAFIRLNPVFPTGVMNYVLGLTGIDVKTYIWATFCFLLPPSIVIALIGHELGTFEVTGDVHRWVQRLALLSAQWRRLLD